MLHIYTFYTDDSRIKYLQQSAEYNNVNIHYIKSDKWNGYVDKIIAIKNVLPDLSYNDIVCFIDAYDVLVNNSYSEIERRFLELNCDILFGAELNCYPNIYINRFPALTTLTTKYRYINAGGYIGYKHAIQKMFEWKSNEDIYNICMKGGDQTYLIEYYLNASDLNASGLNASGLNLKLDDKCRIFQNMHWVNWNEFTFNCGKFTNNILQVTPCFIHFNGGAWQQHNQENIMPVFIDKMHMSLQEQSVLDLHHYQQIVTPRCYPHSQI